MLFVIHRLDAPGMSEARQRHRDTHVAYLREFERHILVAGPYLDEKTGEDRGSMFLVSFDSLKQAQDFVHQDPFAKAGIFSDIQVWPWTRRMGTAQLSEPA